MSSQTGSGGDAAYIPNGDVQHIVVIFGENVSFDHYFGTYPISLNKAGEPPFTAAAGTPVPDGLSGTLLTANPNATNPDNGAAATNPFRLDRAQLPTRTTLMLRSGRRYLFQTTQASVSTSGTNIGDLLTTAGISWGWFEGAFNLSLTNANGTTGCRRSTVSAITGVQFEDYLPITEQFQFYPSRRTCNTHDLCQSRPLEPTGTAPITSTTYRTSPLRW
jgi:hypothetical protein